MYPELNQLDELSRRKFIQYTAKAFLGLGMSAGMHNLLGAEQRLKMDSAKSLIYIYLDGGMSHIDTFDLKPDWEQQGPVKGIATNVTGLKFSAHLPMLARHADKLAIIRSMHSNQGAHDQGQYFLHTSYEPRGGIQHPGLGAWLNKLSGDTLSTLPGNIRLGSRNNLPGGCGFLDTKYDPLHLGNPYNGVPHARLHSKLNPEDFNQRIELVKLLDLSFERQYASKALQAYTDVYKDAIKLMESDDLQAFDLNREPQKLQAAYGVEQSQFAASCLLARRLVESGVKCVQLTSSGWDTHSNNHAGVESRCNEIDRPIAALLDDLASRGLLEETLVVIGTEFGRAPVIDQNLGRNHHPQAFTCILAGGGIQGGQVYGATDERGHSVVDNVVSIPDFNATIAYALGLPVDQVFYSASGRPFKVAGQGQPVLGLFA